MAGRLQPGQGRHRHGPEGRRTGPAEVLALPAGHGASEFTWDNFTVRALGSVVGILLSCSPTAYAFARVRFAGRNAQFALMIGTLLLPLCRPALITSAIFTFINAWNDFMGPLICLNEPGEYTVSLGLVMLRDSDGAVANHGGMIAMSLVALLPVLLFFLAFQQYLIDGMATSGLKG